MPKGFLDQRWPWLAAAAAIVVALMIEDPKPQQDEEPADTGQPAPSS